jgi:hypothetical protein
MVELVREAQGGLLFIEDASAMLNEHNRQQHGLGAFRALLEEVSANAALTSFHLPSFPGSPCPPPPLRHPPHSYEC